MQFYNAISGLMTVQLTGRLEQAVTAVDRQCRLTGLPSGTGYSTVCRLPLSTTRTITRSGVTVTYWSPWVSPPRNLCFSRQLILPCQFDSLLLTWSHIAPSCCSPTHWFLGTSSTYLLVQWQGPIFFENHTISGNKHFSAFSIVLGVSLKFSPSGHLPPTCLFQNPRWPIAVAVSTTKVITFVLSTVE